ncbi:MAG: urease accessory protein UreD [Verrucomicrobia bacterium]|nr:urease accessory protein UreD [Verrucomicrobiota bacterium]
MTANPWKASLFLKFARHENRTVLVDRRHSGPLVIQKPLYPEGDSVCHAVMIHPPGGVAGNDEITVEANLGAFSKAVIANPAATKWYKTGVSIARQETRIKLEQAATLEWLPCENIFFNAARAELSFELSLGLNACAIGWEVNVLGRTAHGENWYKGAITSRSQIRNHLGTLIWAEQNLIEPCSPTRAAAQGLYGYNVFGCLWATSPDCTAMWAEGLAPELPYANEIKAGITCVAHNLLVVRILAHRVEPVRQLLMLVWRRLRQKIIGLAPMPLRLWST